MSDLGLALHSGLARRRRGRRPVPLPGYVFLVDEDGAYLIDLDGNYVIYPMEA